MCFARRGQDDDDADPLLPPPLPAKPPGALAAAIDRDLGGYDAFKKDFAAVNGAAAAAGDALPPSSAVPAAAMATYAFRAPTPAALDEFVAAIEAHKGGEAE